MTSARRHLSNVVMLTGSGAAAKVILFFASVLVYKHLSVNDNGLAGFGLFFGTLAAFVMDAGIRGYVLRQLARIVTDPTAAHQLLSETLFLRLTLAVLLTPVAIAVAWLLGYGATALPVIAIFVSYGLLESFSLLFKAALRCYGRMGTDAIWSAVSKMILLAIIAWAAGRGRLTLNLVALTYAGTSALEMLAMATALWKTSGIGRVPFPQGAGMRRLLAASLPFATMGLLGMIYKGTALFCLSRGSNLRAVFQISSTNAPTNDYLVGLFTTASRIPDMLGFLPIAVMGALIPYLASNKNNQALLTRYFQLLIRYLGALGCACAAVVAFQGSALLLLISKPEYLAGLPTLYWLAAAVPFFFLHYCTANFLICLDEERAFLRRQTIALVLNLFLNVALIPRWSVAGAAAAVCISEIFSLCFDMALCSKHGIQFPWLSVAQWAGIVLAIGVAAWLTPAWSPALRMVPACLAAAAGLLLTVSRSDLNALRAPKTIDGA